MSNSVQNADISGDPGVAAAQRNLDGATQAWIDLGVEAGLLVASSVPGIGWAADTVSLARSAAAGDVAGVVMDAIGFIPFGGDAIKGFFRGRRIRKAMRVADDAMAAARSGVSRAQQFARRRMGASQHWGAVKRRRDEIAERYKNCKTDACREARKRELEQTSRLPSRENGKWEDGNGNPTLPGQGKFVPDEGTNLHNALSRHQSPVTGIDYSDGQPDLSGFPPRGRNNAGPDGNAYSVEIEQAMGPDSTANRTADRNGAWGQWRQNNPDARDPTGGQWHHDTDGVTMQYVDQDVHGALAHEGSASMNTSPEF
jgi:hypothetical protein